MRFLLSLAHVAAVGFSLAPIAWLTAVLTFMAALPARAEVLRLTNNRALERRVQINSAGEVLWESGDQLYLWTAGVVRPITQVRATRSEWKLGEGGHVVWVEGAQ